MATQKDLLADENSEMLDACYQAMKAVIEYRNQVTTIQPGQTTAQLKKTQLVATQQLMLFATSVVFNS